MMGTTAPANSVASPTMEYPAAITDILIADKNVSNVKNIVIFI
jgi:hypothetical protein